MVILRALRADPLLAIATAVLALFAWCPLFVTPILPLHDLAGHVGGAGLMADAIFGSGLAAHHYTVSFVPLPYATLYYLLALFDAALGPFLAAKVVVGFAVLLIPLSTMRLMVALRRSPRLGLWAFALVWDHNMYWGWVAHVLGTAFALFALARLLEAETLRQALRRWPWTVLVAITHPHALASLVGAAAALAVAGQPVRKRLLLHAVGIAPGIVILIPWLVMNLVNPTGSVAKAGLGISWHSLSHKAANLLGYTLGDVTGKFGEGAAVTTFFVLLLFPLLLAGIERQEHVLEDRGAVLLFVASVMLYAVLPVGILRPIEQWYIYPRQATLILLCALLLSRPRLEGLRALWLLPGAAAAALMSVGVALQFAAFSDHARPFLKIIENVVPNRAVLPLLLDDRDPVMKLAPIHQFHAYIPAARGGYDPFLYDSPHVPLRYRRDRKLPAPPWNQMSAFSLTTHAPHYDYILVQGAALDPLREGPIPTGGYLRRVAEAGRWRLYAVDKPSRAGSPP